MPVFEGVIRRRISGAADPCIVDCHIQAAAFLDSELDQLFYGCRIGNIDHKVMGIASERANLGGNALRGVGIKIGNNDLGTFATKSPGNSGSYS